MKDGRVAVLIPCYNEEMTVGKVVDDFHDRLPSADIYVYDNNSTDASAEIARSHGARVVPCPVQGKGAVVRQMFEEVEADYYIMVDADDTYPADCVGKLLWYATCGAHYDMVIGDRLSVNYYEDNKRMFHGLGNTIVRFLVNRLFRGNAVDLINGIAVDVPDIMTGYRVFSRRFVKGMQLKSDGFEIETEMTIRALKAGYSIGTFPIVYRDRPAGSYSKLSTFSDGIRVLRTIFLLRLTA